jgi:hypothetical protein
MKKFVFILFTFAFAVVSCNKEPVSAEGGDSPEVVFKLGGEFSAQTRAASVVNDDSDLSDLYVTATKNGNSQTAVDGFSNAVFRKNGDYWKGVSAKYWPNQDENYRFAISNVQLSNFAVTASCAANTNFQDIVYDYLANPNYKSTNSVLLEHAYARIGTVRILAPDGYTVSGMVLTISPVVSGTFNVQTEAWTNTGSPQNPVSILPKAGSNPSTASINVAGGSVTSDNNDLWLLPGSYNLSITYTIVKGDYRKEFTKTCRNVQIQRGKINNIGPVVQGGVEIPNIPEPDDISEIQFSVSVQEWTEVNIEAQFTN